MIMTVFELLSESAKLFPDRIAVSHDGEHTDFSRLYRASCSLADRLEKLSLPKGSPVGVLFENSVEYVIAFFAVFKAGHVLVPLDTSLGADSLRYVLTNCNAKALLVDARYRRILPEIVAGDSPVEYIFSNKKISSGRDDLEVEAVVTLDEEVISAADSPPFISTADDEEKLAAIFYTSGSTGAPKGVMLSHRNLVSNTLATIEYLRLTQDDAIMVILPFYYIYGNSLLLTHVGCGGRLVIDNRFLYPEAVLDTMESEDVTGFSGVPSNFMILLGKSTFAKRELKALRYFTQAGGAMAPEITRQHMGAFPEKEIFIMYGQTEAAPRVTWLPPEMLESKLGSIGIPVPGVTVLIADNDGNELPVGKVGQIVVDGPNVMMGYWNHAEEEHEVLKGGRLFTGDLAKKDEDGFIYVVGRSKEIIKTGGNRVSVKEIEECLMEDDGILEVAVFGVDDPVLGEAVKAVVVNKKGCESDAKCISDFCRARLASHKVPKIVEFADALPKTKSGKVDKKKLKGNS
jgi:acyl-CoA synthetase (AMP-forming)/AMP-acid ligase II